MNFAKKLDEGYPYFVAWLIQKPHTPSIKRVIELADDRPEYEFQFDALLALAED